PEPRYLTDQPVRLARAVADQAAVAIENARLFTETERRARETEALLRADAELFRSLSLDSVFQALVDVTVDVLGADKGIVTMRDPDSDAIMVRAARNVSEEFLRVSRERLARMSSADSPRRLEIHENHPVHADPGRPAHPGDEPEVISSVDVPVRIAGHVAGSFSVGYTSAHIFSSEEQRVLLALAERASLAITNAEL